MKGFRLPAEWAAQSGVMLTWPHRESYWRDSLDAIDRVFADVAWAVTEREKLLITCLDEMHKDAIKRHLAARKVDLNQVHFVIARADDIWVRDHGPVTVLEDGKPRLLDFCFTGWGHKYPEDNDNENDNKLTELLHAQQAFGAIPRVVVDMVLEGGSIEVDGCGTLLTTQSCLVKAARNPSFSQDAMEASLKHYLGVERILWLTHGHLAGDDTDGHIDTLVRFSDPHTLCYMACDDPKDPHYAGLKKMEAQLKGFCDYQGNPFRLIPLPWPRAHYAAYDGRRLPVTYANFLIMNDAVLLPTYQDPADDAAREVLTDAFPGRDIVAIDALPVVQWYGSLHCMTMQLPEGVL